MKDKLAEIYKLAGFKTKVAKELMHVAHACIEVAYRWENDRLRQECVKAKLKPAASDTTSDELFILQECKFKKLNYILDKEVERASLLAEEDIGDPKWKEYKKLVDKFN